MPKRIGWLLAVAVLGVAGCSPYQLRGVVLEGSVDMIEVVNADDPRLERFGVPGASVQVLLDPDRLSPKTIGRGSTNGDGQFALPINETGAGFLLLDVEVLVGAEGFSGTSQEMVLPGGKQRLVVTLKRGQRKPNDRGNDFERDTQREVETYR